MKNLYKSSTGYKIVSTSTLKVTERLKKIDPKYFVLYNARKDTFEVHHEKNIGSSYCFAVDNLDSEVFHILRKTATHRGQAVFDEMDRANEAMKNRSKKQFMDDVEYGARELSRIIRRS